MAEQCKAAGSIQKLESNKWRTVGIGTLSLLKNHHNPTHILLKLVRKKNGEVYMFQCKPKVKTTESSLICKGTDTRKKREYVLAIRFKEDDKMEEFEDVLNDLYRQNLKQKPNKHHRRNTSLPPKQLRIELSQVIYTLICT